MLSCLLLLTAKALVHVSSILLLFVHWMLIPILAVVDVVSADEMGAGVLTTTTTALLWGGRFEVIWGKERLISHYNLVAGDLGPERVYCTDYVYTQYCEELLYRTV